MADVQNDFFEEDEPQDAIEAEFDSSPKRFTAPPVEPVWSLSLRVTGASSQVMPSKIGTIVMAPSSEALLTA